KKTLVKHLSVFDPFACFDQDIIADDQIRDQIKYKSQPARYRQEIQKDQQGRCRKDTDQHLFLFLIHKDSPSRTSHLLNDYLIVKHIICLLTAFVNTFVQVISKMDKIISDWAKKR